MRRRHRRDYHRLRRAAQGPQPDLHVVAVEPKASPVLSGGLPGPHKIQGIGAGFVPEVLNREVVDEILPVDDEDAIETARLSAAREGVLAGISGSRRCAAIEVGSRPELSGKRDGDRSRLGRALRQHAILCTVIGFQTFARVVQEVREDLTAAQQRDPAARTVSRAEILLTYGGVQALLAHRVTRCTRRACR